MQEVFHERLKSPIPRTELERRNSDLQEAMRAKGIDCIVSQNLTPYFGGGNRWLTDTTAGENYPQSVILPANGEVRYIACSGPPLDLFPPPHLTRIGKPYAGAPYFSVFNFTNTWEGRFVVQWAKENGAKKIGIPGFGMFQWNFYDYIEKNLPGVELIDVAQMLDELRVIKSEADISFIEKSAEVADKVMNYIITFALPGVREYEVRSKMMQLITDHGGEEMIILMGSAPRGEVFRPLPSFYQNRVLEKGDLLYVCLKSSGPGGFYTTVGRMYSIGCEPSECAKKGFEQVLEAQKMLVGMLECGADMQAVQKDYNDYLKSIGCEPDEDMFVYGQGYNHLERPCALPGETMKLAKGVCLSVNTSLVSPTKSMFCADSFLIEQSGARKLHKASGKIFRTGA